MPSSVRTRLIAACVLLLTLGISRADVPTAEQDCRNRNAALCETAGVQFVVDGPCAATARTIVATAAEFNGFMATEAARWAQAIKTSGAKVD